MENIAEKLKGSAEEYSEYLPGVLMTGIEMISRFTLPKFHFVSVSWILKRKKIFSGIFFTAQVLVNTCWMLVSIRSQHFLWADLEYFVKTNQACNKNLTACRKNKSSFSEKVFFRSCWNESFDCALWWRACVYIFPYSRAKGSNQKSGFFGVFC